MPKRRQPLLIVQTAASANGVGVAIRPELAEAYKSRYLDRNGAAVHDCGDQDALPLRAASPQGVHERATGTRMTDPGWLADGWVARDDPRAAAGHGRGEPMGYWHVIHTGTCVRQTTGGTAFGPCASKASTWASSLPKSTGLGW